jgi:ATP-dependent DNA ligase
MPSFDRLRYRRGDGTVFLYAFDLIELNGRDLRREPLEARKRALATVLRASFIFYPSGERRIIAVAFHSRRIIRSFSRRCIRAVLCERTAEASARITCDR